MKDIYIHCMGCPSLQVNGTPVRFQRNKAFILLTYLYITNRTYSREELTDFFWPDMDLKKAKANLRNILSECRQNLGSEIFYDEKQTISLRRSDINSDYSKFMLLAESEEKKDLEKAADLFNEGFLKGMEVARAPQFDDWQFEIQQQLEIRYINLLEKLAAEEHRSKNISSEISWLKKLINTNPLCEDYHRFLILCYSESRDYTSAVHQYKLLKKYLKEDGSGSPEPETLKLMQKIQKERNQTRIKRTVNPDEYILQKNHAFLSGKPVRIIIITISIMIIVSLYFILADFRTTIPKQRISIAVLPFTFLCNDNNAKGFSEIFTMDMINSLEAEDYMSVTPALSVGKYKDSVLTVKQIGEELNVKYIIHGSAMSFSECIRFSVQLIDVTANECTWTGSFSCESDNSLMTQNEVIEYLKENIIKEIGRPR